MCITCSVGKFENAGAGLRLFFSLSTVLGPTRDYWHFGDRFSFIGFVAGLYALSDSEVDFWHYFFFPLMNISGMNLSVLPIYPMDKKVGTISGEVIDILKE